MIQKLVCLILSLESCTTHGFSLSLLQKKPSISLFYFQEEELEAKQQKHKRQVYKHVFRHYGDISFDSWLRCADPEPFLLSVGYTEEEINELSQSYPPLLTLNVHDQLAPKIRFLVETLEGGTGQLKWEINEKVDFPTSQSHDEEECPTSDERDNVPHHSMLLSESTKQAIPSSFYGCLLDRTVGPNHAYLMHHQLPHGSQLLDKPEMLHQFLQASKSPKTFAALCQEWSNPDDSSIHSIETIHDFQCNLSAGLLAASKDICSFDNALPLLLKHGYSPLEHDPHGLGPLHWTAGAGNLQGTQALVQVLQQEEEASSLLDLLQNTRDPKKGATPFHWACSGMTTDYEGGGGSLDICRWMLEQQAKEDPSSLEELGNLPTWTDQSTPLMYAAWGGNLEICQLLVEQGGANPLHTNARGEMAVHWAAAAGHLDVCQYLVQRRYQKVLESPHLLDQGLTLQHDHRGQTPFDYAFEYDREDVMEWMMQLL